MKPNAERKRRHTLYRLTVRDHGTAALWGRRSLLTICTWVFCQKNYENPVFFKLSLYDGDG